MSTPVLLLLFNRPDYTQKLLNAIRIAKPSEIYVVADGPRPHVKDEDIKCAEVRKLVGNIDWKCRIITRFRDTNLGCKLSVGEGITWFFNNVEQGIILEDDCIPDPSFFPYCEELLSTFKNDERIMHISGDNFQFGTKRGQADYYFSIFNHVWGWATWRRAWEKFSFEIDISTVPSLYDFVRSREILNYFSLNFELIANDKLDTWDFLWTYACWKHRGLSILPNVNLVTNIGFRIDATHTKNQKSIQNNIPSRKINSPLKHPREKNIHRKADKYTFYHIFRPLTVRDRIYLLKRKLLFK